MTLTKTLLMTATTVILTSTTAMAIGVSGKTKLLDADLNGDASITLEEFSAAAKTRFNAADTDANGFLTEAERDAARATARTDGANSRFDASDANGDGVLSRDEVQASLSERGNRRGDDDETRTNTDKGTSRRGRMSDAIKAKIDTDGNGEISDTEKAAARDALRETRDENRTERANRGEGERNERQRDQRQNVDADNDGMISLTELDTKVTALFAKMDTNQDGVLTDADKTERGNRRQGRRGGNR